HHRQRKEALGRHIAEYDGWKLCIVMNEASPENARSHQQFPGLSLPDAADPAVSAWLAMSAYPVAGTVPLQVAGSATLPALARTGVDTELAGRNTAEQ